MRSSRRVSEEELRDSDPEKPPSSRLLTIWEGKVVLAENLHRSLKRPRTQTASPTIPSDRWYTTPLGRSLHLSTQSHRRSGHVSSCSIDGDGHLVSFPQPPTNIISHDNRLLKLPGHVQTRDMDMPHLAMHLESAKQTKPGYITTASIVKAYNKALDPLHIQRKSSRRRPSHPSSRQSEKYSKREPIMRAGFSSVPSASRDEMQSKEPLSRRILDYNSVWRVPRKPLPSSKEGPQSSHLLPNIVMTRHKELPPMPSHIPNETDPKQFSTRTSPSDVTLPTSKAVPCNACVPAAFNSHSLNVSQKQDHRAHISVREAPSSPRITVTDVSEGGRTMPDHDGLAVSASPKSSHRNPYQRPNITARRSYRSLLHTSPMSEPGLEYLQYPVPAAIRPPEVAQLSRRPSRRRLPLGHLRSNSRPTQRPSAIRGDIPTSFLSSPTASETTTPSETNDRKRRASDTITRSPSSSTYSTDIRSEHARCISIYSPFARTIWKTRHPPPPIAVPSRDLDAETAGAGKALPSPQSDLSGRTRSVGVQSFVVSPLSSHFLP
ncbi:hypothetical protein MMC19_002911 [Ptychographa xylographoides]|nr:hypothetical protein [Ptychographa xylographoides]